jgi:hypothetical protein
MGFYKGFFLAMTFLASVAARADGLTQARKCAVHAAPLDGSSHVKQCFVVDITLDIDPINQTFDLNGFFSRRSCGGWPPYFQPAKGTIRSSGTNKYDLIAPDFTASITLVDANSILLSEPGADYLLTCEAQ